MDPNPSRRQPTAAQLVADIEATQVEPERPATETMPLAGERTPWIAVAALIAVAVATVLAIALAGGGGSSPSGTSASSRGGGGAHHNGARAAQPPTHHSPATAGSVATTTSPASSARSAPATGAALGAQLNDQGYALVQSGDYADAVPVLRRAVAAFPPGTSDIRYAYALFNLGHALRMAGDPAAAIPILEQRLRIPDQTDVVQHELDAARAALAAPAPGKPEPAKPPKPREHLPPGLEGKPKHGPPGQGKKDEEGG